jgi:hypothetical protein
MRLGLGGAALVGLTRRRSLRVLEAAARRIEAESSPRQCRDLWAVLRMLSEERYTARELERVVPEEVVMASSLVAKVRRQSRAEGIRSVCEDLVKQHHPGVLSTVAPLIEACLDQKLLRQWVLAAPLVSDTEFVRLIKSTASDARAKGSARGSGRVRVPRPSKRARPRR